MATGKPPRSPLVGYNHNIAHLGRVFHVQTEDSGPATPRLFTHLFFHGTILASMKHEYDAAIGEDKVRALMQGLHKSMIRDLLQAKFDDRLVPFFRARGEEILPPPAPGALPDMPMADTAGPAVMSPAPEVSIPAPSPGARRNTRPFVSLSGAVVRRPPGESVSVGAVRSSESYRSPGPRNPTVPGFGVPQAVQSDRVLVERNVVVGGSPSPPQRPVRVRPAIPAAPRTEAGESASTSAAPLPSDTEITERTPTHSQEGGTEAAAFDDNASGRVAPDPTAAPSSRAQDPAPDGPRESPAGARRGRSLDDAILEYLGDDPDA